MGQMAWGEEHGTLGMEQRAREKVYGNNQLSIINNQLSIINPKNYI